MNGGGAGDVPNEMNGGSLRDIGDCSNELMGMDTSGGQGAGLLQNGGVETKGEG